MATVPGATNVVSGLRTQAPAEPFLNTVNAYRISLGLPPVVNDPRLQDGVTLHARYLALTGSVAHTEAPSNPLYSPAGALAASQSLVGGWSGRQRSDREFVEDWLIAPFHAIHLFEPRLQRIALGVSRNEPGAILTEAAVLNVTAGIGPKVWFDDPIVFPADGSTVPLSAFRTETPSPLTHCPGYTAPAGLPVIAMFPSSPESPTAEMTADGIPLEVCVIDSGYRNPDPNAQQVGHLLLTQKNAVVVVPRLPLQVGVLHEVVVRTGRGGTARWSFRVGAEGSSLPGPSRKPIALRAGPKAPAKAVGSKKLG